MNAQQKVTPEQMPLGRAKARRLSFKQNFDLCNWLLENREIVEGKARSVISAKAAKALGFTVIDQHIATAAKTLEVDWLQATTKTLKKSESVEELRLQNQLLARAVLALANGQQPPAIDVIEKLAK